VVSAICSEPEPQESDPVVESGVADAGEERFGEGAVSVTVRCGSGGRWTAGGCVVEANSFGEGIFSGADTGRGLTLAWWLGVGAGARPGKYVSDTRVPESVPGRVKTCTGRMEKRNAAATTACAATESHVEAGRLRRFGSGENMSSTYLF